MAFFVLWVPAWPSSLVSGAAFWVSGATIFFYVSSAAFCISRAAVPREVTPCPKKFLAGGRTDGGRDIGGGLDAVGED